MRFDSCFRIVRTVLFLSALAAAAAAHGAAPMIVTSPTNQTVAAGEGVELKAEAKNCGDFTIDLPNGVVLEMVGIEPGSFTMGSPTGEIGRVDVEGQFGVTLSHGFWIGKYEVTQDQYVSLMGINTCRSWGRIRRSTWGRTCRWSA